ncbi:hypothetical protein [Usitatibacter rugosus]|nr:hypothetical protein [Usitatibacter rugosus]
MEHTEEDLLDWWSPPKAATRKQLIWHYVQLALLVPIGTAFAVSLAFIMLGTVILVLGLLLFLPQLAISYLADRADVPEAMAQMISALALTICTVDLVRSRRAFERRRSEVFQEIASNVFRQQTPLGIAPAGESHDRIEPQ